MKYHNVSIPGQALWETKSEWTPTQKKPNNVSCPIRSYLRKQQMWMKYLVLAVGGSVNLQEGTGGVVWAAGVKHAVDFRNRRNTWVGKKQKTKKQIINNTTIVTLTQKES